MKKYFVSPTVFNALVLKLLPALDSILASWSYNALHHDENEKALLLKRKTKIECHITYNPTTNLRTLFARHISVTNPLSQHLECIYLPIFCSVLSDWEFRIQERYSRLHKRELCSPSPRGVRMCAHVINLPG